MLVAQLGVRTRTTSAVVILILALGALGSAQQPMQSPVDSTVNPSIEVQTTATQNAAAQNIMMGWMTKNLGTQLAMKDPMHEFAMTGLFKDRTNQWNGHLTQMFKGIPVRSGHLEIAVQEGAADASHWSGQYLNDPEVDTNPTLSQADAVKIATKMLKDMLKQKGGEADDSADAVNGSANSNGSKHPNKSLLVDSGKSVASAGLEIHPGDGPGRRKLTYHVVVSGHSRQQGKVQLHAWVDQNGNIAEAYDNIQPVCFDGLGETLYQGLQGNYFGSFFGNGYFKVYPAFGGYVLNNNCLRWGTYDNYNGSTTYQAFSPSIIFGNSSTSNRESSNADVALSSQQAYSFEYWVLGRNGPDGNGGPGYYPSVDGLGNLVSARNHIGVNYVNAYWDGGATNFGDGDGVRSGPLTSLDIVAHEWQHAVTQYTANLVYANESGAVNESLSDIMGAMAERYWYGETPTYVCGLNTWKMGELAWTPGNGNCDALRYLYAPWLGNQPWNYQNLTLIGTGVDNGGVHTNSGISNYAFYIMSKGGCGYFCLSPYPSGIGAGAATAIFWRAERVYMSPFDGFAELRQKTIWAAGDYYGYYGPVWQQVRDAWDAVGVPKMCTFNFFGICLSYGD